VNGDRLPVPSVASLRVDGAGGRDLGLDEGTLPPSSYVTIERAWKAGDIVELALPKSLRLEPTPDDHTVAAIMWGPLVLAGDLGPRRERGEREPKIDPGALIAGGREITEWVVPNGGRAGDFRATGVARRLASPGDDPGDVPLAPFYRTHGRTYSIYFDVLTRSELESRMAERVAETTHDQQLESATVAFAQPGRPADEQSFNYVSEPASRQVTRTDNRTGRGGTGWFSFDLPIEPARPQSLIVTYHNDLGLPLLARFQIQIDGTTIAQFAPNRTATGFWDAEYPIPAALVTGKTKVTVRFIPNADGRIAPVYGIRIVSSGRSS
jgi:hypothetical protein